MRLVQPYRRARAVAAVISIVLVGCTSPAVQTLPASTPQPQAIGVYVDPAAIHCSVDTDDMTFLMRIPGSVPESQELWVDLDGIGLIFDFADLPDGWFIRDPNGNWLSIRSLPVAKMCNGLPAGNHHVRVIDTSYHVLADGTFSSTR